MAVSITWRPVPQSSFWRLKSCHSSLCTASKGRSMLIKALGMLLWDSALVRYLAGTASLQHHVPVATANSPHRLSSKPADGGGTQPCCLQHSSVLTAVSRGARSPAPSYLSHVSFWRTNYPQQLLSSFRPVSWTEVFHDLGFQRQDSLPQLQTGAEVTLLWTFKTYSFSCDKNHF